MSWDSLPRLLCLAGLPHSLSGDPEAEFWSGVPSGEFRECMTGAVPEQGSSVRLGWNRQELRILFVAKDRDPWATMTRRKDPLYQEEVFEVFLDPTGDGACYFEIEVNPLNAVLDLVVRKNRSGWIKDFAWRCEGLQTAVFRQHDGWAAELSIPFSALGSIRPETGSAWRANFCRIDRPKGRERELTAWSPTRCGTFHFPDRFGTIEFCGRDQALRGWASDRQCGGSGVDP